MSQNTAKKQSYYLPLELWQRIFFQHTDLNQLWIAGRQVCSLWRSEIPKVFAKKYLENPDMVQMYFDLGGERIEGEECFMAAKLVFSRYEGEFNKRCVFTESSSTNGRARMEPNSFNQKYERCKHRVWRDGVKRYLGIHAGVRKDGGRFDLPPHQICIKSRARDSELPKLAFESNKREISFEWEGMFTQFFLESAMLADAEAKIMTESIQWLEDGNPTIVGAMAHKKKRSEALRNAAKNVRRHRIKRFYLDNHNYVFKDHLFEEGAEENALDAIQEHELRCDFTRCAEDTESKERAETHADSRDMFEFMETMRGIKGVREDDENGLMALLVELMGAGGPGEEDEDEEDDGDDSNVFGEQHDLVNE
jgi:hypothetical protein